MYIIKQNGKHLSLRQRMARRYILLMVVTGLLPGPVTLASRIYVDVTHTTGTFNGTSWATAYSRVDQGLNAAVNGDSIWVAQGSYTAPSGTSYIMKEGVAVFGGFAKTDTVFSQRDWTNRLTTLRASSRTVIRNVFTAVAPLTNTAVLDGFTISGGSAGSATPIGGGMANVYASPTVRNVVFSGNTASSSGNGTGGGMYNSYSSPVLTNVRFTNNTAIKSTDVSGGGMYNSFSSPVLTNVVFETNQCTSTTGLSTGGAMANFNSAPVLKNVTFRGNYCTGGANPAASAVARGGAIGNYNGSVLVCNKVIFSSNYCLQPTLVTNTFGGALFTGNDSSSASLLTNVIFTDNSASNGAAIYGDSANLVIAHASFNSNKYRQGAGIGNIATRRSSRLKIVNSVFHANAGADTVIPAVYIVNNCYNEIAFAGSTGTGNIVGSSMPFVDPLNPAGSDDIWFTADDGLRLKNGIAVSPVNAGITISAPDYPASVALEATTDMLGTPRPAGAAYDIGAYEGGFTKVPQRYYVDSVNIAGTHNGNSWATAYNKLEDALLLTGSNDTIWVAKGTYQPAYGSSFKMRNGTAIYGGFNNTDTGFVQRNYVQNKSILKGNARSVIVNDCSVKAMMTNASLLDGFTVTGGEAIASTGGGMTNLFAAPTIRNVIFSGNTGSVYPGGGGGMYNWYSSPILTNVTVSGNRASSSGGGMFNLYSSPVITNSTIFGNTAGGIGGGMYNWYSSPVLTNSIISGNTCENGSGATGGGMYNLFSNPVLTDVLFDGNRSASFAGISAGGAMANYTGSPVLTNVIFSRNRADNTHLVIVTDPGASSCGGAVANYNNSVVTCNNVVFDSNYCVQPVTPSRTFGGAIFNNKDSSSASVMANAVFYNNSAAVGAAIYSDSAINYMVNATFYNNKYSNGFTYAAVYDRASRLKLVNCIFHGHAGITAELPVSYIVHNSYNSLDSFAGNSGNGNIIDTSSPFANKLHPKGLDGTWLTSDDGLQLNFCSAAVNAGNNDSVANTPLDILGHTRIKNSITDMGAYEKQSNTTNGQRGSNAALSTDNSNALSFLPVCDDNGWTFYADPTKPDSLGFAISWGAGNTAVKANAKVYLTLDSSNTGMYDILSGVWTMRRYWNVDLNGGVLANPVQVKFYYNPADTVALHASAVAAGFTGQTGSVQWFKTSGGLFDPSQVSAVDINNGNYVLLSTVFGSENNVAYVQFNNVNSFSGGTAALTAGSAVALPVRLLDFTAVKNPDNKSVLTRWEVVNEDLGHYEVERSTDALRFQTAGKIMAAGSTVYTFDDVLPGSEYHVLYYRLKMADKSGNFTYSFTRKVRFDDKTGYTTIAPNPATTTVSVKNTNAGLNGREALITDVTGRLILRFVVSPSVRLDVSNYQPGVYLIKLPDGGVLKLIRE